MDKSVRRMRILGLVKKMKLNDQNENIERILESAIVANWTDLMRRDRSGLIHIEYRVTSSGSLDYLQVWSSIKRGYWVLVCTYWMSASQSHDIGVHFDNGYESKGLAHILEVVMQHQNGFALPRHFGGQGLLLIATPTAAESETAAASLSNAFDRIKSAPTEVALAR